MSTVIQKLKWPETKKLIYKRVVSEDGIAWVYPLNVENSADFISCTASADWDAIGAGCGGSDLSFELLSGEIFVIHGPWHANADTLLERTGVDLTEKYYTRCVIAEKWLSHNPCTVEDILYNDREWTLGSYKRGNNLAEEFANNLGSQVFLFKQSFTGGSQGYVQPKPKTETEWLED